MKKSIIFICILLCTLKSIAYAENLNVVEASIYVNLNMIPGNGSPSYYSSYMYNDRIYLSIDDIAQIYNRSASEDGDIINFYKSDEVRLYAYKDLSHERGGFKDEDGNIIIEPNYDVESYSLNEGYGVVFGFKDKNIPDDFKGTFLIDTQGELQAYVPSTLVTVFQGDKALGRWSPNYGALSQLPERLCYVDANGNIDFEVQRNITVLDIPDDGKVQKTEKIVCIDDTPIKITNPILSVDNKIYLPLRDIADGFGWEIDWYRRGVRHNVELYSYPKKEQLDIARMAYYDTLESYYNDGKFSVDKVICGRKRIIPGDDTYGYVDENNNEIVSPYTYDDAYDFSENMALVANYVYEKVYNENSRSYYEKESDIEYYFIDLYGNPLFDKTFAFAKSFSEGFAAVVVEGSIYPKPTDNIRWSFIDNKGNYVTDMKFEDVRSFKNGYAKVKQNGKWGVVDTDFNVVVDFKYDRLVQLVEDVDFID